MRIDARQTLTCEISQDMPIHMATNTMGIPITSKIMARVSIGGLSELVVEAILANRRVHVDRSLAGLSSWPGATLWTSAG